LPTPTPTPYLYEILTTLWLLVSPGSKIYLLLNRNASFWLGVIALSFRGRVDSYDNTSTTADAQVEVDHYHLKIFLSLLEHLLSPRSKIPPIVLSRFLLALLPLLSPGDGRKALEFFQGVMRNNEEVRLGILEEGGGVCEKLRGRRRRWRRRRARMGRRTAGNEEGEGEGEGEGGDSDDGWLERNLLREGFGLLLSFAPSPRLPSSPKAQTPPSVLPSHHPSIHPLAAEWIRDFVARALSYDDEDDDDDDDDDKQGQNGEMVKTGGGLGVRRRGRGAKAKVKERGGAVQGGQQPSLISLGLPSSSISSDLGRRYFPPPLTPDPNSSSSSNNNNNNRNNNNRNNNNNNNRNQPNAPRKTTSSSPSSNSSSQCPSPPSGRS